MPDNWIPTPTGGRVFFDPIDVSEVKLRDISLGLARVSRFNGMYRQEHSFYSVAEHCTMGSYIAPIGSKLAFHVHDAAEAFLGDVTSPLKRLLPDYKRIEREFEEALWRKFGWPDSKTATVKRIDMEMLAAEREAMVHHMGIPWSDLEGVAVPKVTFNFWLPSLAWVCWEDRYKELKERGG